MYVSDVVDLKKVDRSMFNLIISGTGTGKTFFIANNIHKQLPDIHNSEILFVASRSLIVDQQSKSNTITKFNHNDSEVIEYWNGKRDRSIRLHKQGIQIMTYDKIIEIILNRNETGLETLSNIKVIVFDECHTLFSDKFIENMEALKVWIRDTIYQKQKIIIGMTATYGIIEFYKEKWGVELNLLTENPLIKYKANQLICTTFDSVPYLVATQLEGRTMILCYSYKDCLKLKEQIPNSFILVSKNNENFTPEMRQVRDYIVSREMVPETYVDKDGNANSIDVLITTSTLREGVNLREEGGIKNIVCCFSDELHIVQFAGRARYDLDKLVVAETYISSDNLHPDSYLAQSRRAYKDFMEMKDNLKWFMQICQIVKHSFAEVLKVSVNKQEEKFIEYINKRWLVPKDAVDIAKYRIYKDEDKNEIIKMAMQTKLLFAFPSQFSFFKVIEIMKNGLGYSIESKQSKVDKKNTRYKLVVDFDESKVDLQYVDKSKWNTKVK